MTAIEITVRLDESQLARLDSLIADGQIASRAAAVRSGVAAVIDVAESRRIDAAICAGYERQPPAPDELDAAQAAMRTLIAAEPW